MSDSTRAMSEIERSDLAAFLASELQGGDSARWEARIANDPATNAEASALREAWDCLDLLSFPKPSVSLSERTLRLVADSQQSAIDDDSSRARPVRWRDRLAPLAWAAAVLLAATAGYRFTKRPPDPNRPLLEHLPLLQRFDELKAAGDVDFLRALHQAKLLDQIDPPEIDAASTGGRP